MPARCLAPACWPDFGKNYQTKPPWALSRIGAETAPAPQRLLVSLGLAYPPCGGVTHPLSPRTCFFGGAESRMFAGIPLVQRTVDKIAALATVLAFSSPLKLFRG